MKPGDDGYRLAELPFRPSYEEAAAHTAKDILRVLEVAESGVPETARHGTAPRAVIEAWQARDRGEDPEVAPDDALTRMRYAFASLPDDLRSSLAA